MIQTKQQTEKMQCSVQYSRVECRPIATGVEGVVQSPPLGPETWKRSALGDQIYRIFSSFRLWESIYFIAFLIKESTRVHLIASQFKEFPWLGIPDSVFRRGLQNLLLARMMRH